MPIDLVSENGILMSDKGAGNRLRFAALFRRVWASINPEQKDRILIYWRKFSGVPQFDLVMRHRYPGENEDYGCRVKFNAEAIDWAPEDKVASLIAHELGHVLSYADPESASSKASGRASIEKLNKIKEDEADALAESWGFDMAALREWGNENSDQFKAFGCKILDGFTY